MKPKVIEDSSTSTSTDEEEEIEAIAEQIVCKMKPKEIEEEEVVEDKPKKTKRTKKSALSDVKAEDIVETSPNKNVVSGKDFAKLTKKGFETWRHES